MPGLARLGMSSSGAGAVSGTTGAPVTATALGPCADSLEVGREDRPMTQAVSQSNGTASTSLDTVAAYHGHRAVARDGRLRCSSACLPSH
jgi:hypothetical protein